MNRKHGQSAGPKETPTYTTWVRMRRRCNNPNHSTYQYYGGRGIKVCERWDSFDSFLKDMGEKPEGMTLDRINNDGNYEPGNCRWSTHKEQVRNTSQNRLFTVNGKTQCLSAWAEEAGINFKTVHTRISRNWSIERALGRG
jgi:hypothetical protein